MSKAPSPVAMDLGDLPRDLTRPARGVLFAACLVCDEETGEVRGEEEGETGQQHLARICGYEGRSAVSEAIGELVSYRLMARVGFGPATRLFVVMDRKREQEDRACEVCGEAVAKLKGAKRCASCLQIQRREWKADALEIWHRGKRLGWTDMKIAMVCHIRLKRPLWGRAEEGVQGSGSGEDEGVVPALVALRVFPEEMLTAARLARRGEEGE